MRRLGKISLGGASAGFVIYIYSLLQSVSSTQMNTRLLLLGSLLFATGASLFVYNFFRVSKQTK